MITASVCSISHEAPRVVSLVRSFERKVLILKNKKVPYRVTVMTTSTKYSHSSLIPAIGLPHTTLPRPEAPTAALIPALILFTSTAQKFHRGRASNFGPDDSRVLISISSKLGVQEYLISSVWVNLSSQYRSGSWILPPCNRL